MCEYLYYNQKHAESKDVSDMDIPPELCLELLIAADYLDGTYSAIGWEDNVLTSISVKVRYNKHLQIIPSHQHREPPSARADDYIKKTYHTIKWDDNKRHLRGLIGSQTRCGHPQTDSNMHWPRHVSSEISEAHDTDELNDILLALSL